MADNGGHQDECCNASYIERKAERLSSQRNREQRTPKTKDRLDESHLPTPPPDPWRTPECLQARQGQDEMARARSLEEEEDIIAYLTDIGTPPFESHTSECPSRNSATSTMAVTSLCTEETFEHLDRLYALTEQVLELRNRSSKLFRRVRDLERLKALRNAHRRLESAFASDKDLITNFFEEDTGFAESLLDAMLSNCRDPQIQRRSNRSPSSRLRSRSLGLSEQSLPRLTTPLNRNDVEKQTLRNEGTTGGPKVSKWTRVKAAFKWERACTNDIVEAMDTTTTTTPSTPTTKYLRIPEAGSGNWSGSTLSPCTSEISGPSTPLGRVSSASSSNEGSYDSHRKNTSIQLDRQSLKAREDRKKEGTSRRSRSLDGDIIMTNVIDNAERQNETCPGKPLIRVTADNNPTEQQSCLAEKKTADVVSRRPTPTLTITIPSNEEEVRSISSPESMSPLFSSTQNSGGNSPQQVKARQESSTSRYFKRQRSTLEEVVSAPKMQRQDSKWNKVRRAFLTNTAFSVPPSPVRVVSGQSFLQDGTRKAYSCSGSVEDLEKSATSTAQAETRRDYQALREKLGAEFHRKLVEWERLKGSSSRVSARSNAPSGNANSREGLQLLEERLAPEFKKKLQDWKRAKKGRRGSATIEQQRFSRRRLTDWQLWRSPSKPDSRNQDTIGSRGSCGSGGSAGSAISDGRPHLCEDFVRRMEAWRRMNDASYRANESSKRAASNRLGVAYGIDESEFLVLERLLPNFGEKLNRERRGSDSRHVYERFDGDTRFEGISREFTRKLYDWEKYRGISPRSSTFRLLGPGYAPFAGDPDVQTPTTTANVTNIADEEKVFLGILKRSKSAGSVIVKNLRNETFVRRFTSLQSLSRIANKLNDTDRTDISPAPTDPQRPEDAIMDDSEPEAMIVDIEDVIEETASPLNRVQPHQTPVYSVAASETTSIAVPLGTVTSSHEPSPVFLVEVEDSSSCKHWESRTWNPKKNISSKDSPSPEYFDVSKEWNETVDARGRNNLEPEYWSLPASWDQDKYSSRDSFDCYKLKDWKQQTGCVNRGENDTKSDRSTSPTERCVTHQAEAVDEIRDRSCVSLDREGLPPASFDEEYADQGAVKKYMPTTENEMNPVEMLTESGIHSDLLKDIKEKMDLSSEKRCGHEGRKDEEDESDNDEKDPSQDEGKPDAAPQPTNFATDNSDASTFAHPRTTAENRDVSRIFSNSPTKSESDRDEDVFDADFCGSSRQGEVVQRLCEDCTTIRHDFDVRQLNEWSNVKIDSYDYKTKYNQKDTFEEPSSMCANPRSTYENLDNCFKGTFLKPTERVEQNEHRRCCNFHSATTSFTHPIMSTTTAFEYHREPTIQTTPLTVTASREERCFERIIINEETLNKIVVPTATASDTKKTTRSIERPSHADRPQEQRDHQCEAHRDNSVSREANPKNSPTRNVFVKTKRMIFSPFRRTDESTAWRKDGELADDDRMLRPKSKSKSRSASPKMSRQDTLLRMPLSLPWPLRPSSRDRELRLETKLGERLEGAHKGKERIAVEIKDLRRHTIAEEQKRDSEEDVSCHHNETSTPEPQQRTERKLQSLRKEKLSMELTEGNGKPRNSVDLQGRRVQVYKEYGVQTTTREQKSESLVTVSSSCLRNSENQMEISLRSDPLSSDLIHKLKILSNAAARRDGRTNTISIDSSIESHSSRIRRAKENFLSRRGGPLCHSVLDPQTTEVSNHDCTRATSNPYEDTLGNCEVRPEKNQEALEAIDWRSIPSTSENTEVSQQEEVKSEVNGEDEENECRSEVSASSRPDLVKSASAGMINVNPDTFGRLAEPNRGCESLPRTICKRRESGPFARIVNKFKLSRLIRGKDCEEDSMSTISKLCRQSLLIDVQSDFEEHREGEDQDSSEESLPKRHDDGKTRDAKK